jgi:hypothetical protein
MKMLMLVYGGSNPRRITSLLDRHHAGGYSEFRNVHGAGTTGRREGTRAWPGESSLFVSVVPKDRADDLVATLGAEARTLSPGEHLHVAVLPLETFI